MNESNIERLISLIKQGIIVVDAIKNADYKTEVQNRLSTS